MLRTNSDDCENGRFGFLENRDIQQENVMSNPVAPQPTCRDNIPEPVPGLIAIQFNGINGPHSLATSTPSN